MKKLLLPFICLLALCGCQKERTLVNTWNVQFWSFPDKNNPEIVYLSLYKDTGAYSEYKGKINVWQIGDYSSTNTFYQYSDNTNILRIKCFR